MNLHLNKTLNEMRCVGLQEVKDFIEVKEEVGYAALETKGWKRRNTFFILYAKPKSYYVYHFSFDLENQTDFLFFPNESGNTI